MKQNRVFPLLLSMSALCGAVALADSNFNNSQDDFLWSTAENWNNVPDSAAWVYINNSGIGAAHPKTSAESPVILNIPGTPTDVANLNLGWGTDDAGWLEVRSDLNVLNNSIIGRAAGSMAGIRFVGGTTTYGRTITCGNLAGANGTVVVDGGTLHCSPTADYNLVLGNNGSGSLYVRSGRLKADFDLSLGTNPGAVGLMEVSGGEVYVGRNMSHWMSDATYRQTGGSVVVDRGSVILGSGFNNGVPSHGLLEVAGGSLVISNKLFASQQGCCDLVVTGGTVWVGSNGIAMGTTPTAVVTGLLDGAETTLSTTGEIYLSAGNGSRGVFVQKNGALSAQILNLASVLNSVARYGIEGGSLSVSNVMRVGIGGTAEFVQAGGDVYVARQLNIGAPTNDNNAFDPSQPLDTYTMTGGTLTAASVTRLGNNGGNGCLALLGGTSVFNGWVFIGNGTKNGVHGRGELVLGGEASATFSGEVGVGADDTESHGTLHVLGGGSGTRVFRSNVYFRNDPVLKATIDRKGLNPISLSGRLELHDTVTVTPGKAEGAAPGRYAVLRYNGLLQDEGCTFILDPSADTSRWELDFDTGDKALYLTLHAPGTVFVVK